MSWVRKNMCKFGKHRILKEYLIVYPRFYIAFW